MSNWWVPPYLTATQLDAYAASARVRQHRGNDTSFRTFTKTYSFGAKVDPGRKERGGRGDAGGS